MYGIGVASSGITFIPNFVKIGQLFQKLKEKTHSMVTHSLTEAMTNDQITHSTMFRRYGLKKLITFHDYPY
jgi:hypothetical protein